MVPIRHAGVTRCFILTGHIEEVVQLVKHEFNLIGNCSIALAVDVEQYPQVIVPFDADVIRHVWLVNKPKVFELRVYPSESVLGGESPRGLDLSRGVNKVTAAFDFEAATDKEISFRAGDVIEVVGKYNRDWYKGRIGDHVGFFPANYVRGLENVHVQQVDAGELEGEGDWQDHEYFDSYANLVRLLRFSV
jgi:hypothetical protein